ncbi:MAG: CerR family C-terminal domain-containing protein [Planctomycetota bacterium]
MPTEEQDVKQQLIATAMRLFATHGRDGVSLRDIASEAGVTHGSIRYHFGTKDKLYIEALQRFCSVSDLFGEPQCSGIPAASSQSDGEHQLTEFIHRFVTAQAHLGQDKAASAGMLQAEFARGDGPDPAFYKRIIKPGHDHVIGIIGRIRPDITDDKTLEILAFNVIFQCVMIRIGQPVIKKRLASRRLSKADVTRIAESIAEITIGGLRAFKR